MKTYVIYHDNCVDGFCSAFVAWLGLGMPSEDDVQFIPATHGHGKNPPKVEPGSRVFIFDFSYDANKLIELSRQCNFIEIHDHHKDAMKALDGCGLPVTFDINKSGAHLALDRFFPNYALQNDPITSAIVEMVNCVEDQDLYRWTVKDSLKICSVLGSIPRNFSSWQQFLMKLSTNRESIIEEGEARLKISREVIDEYKGRAFPVLFKDPQDGQLHKIYIVNSSVMHSVICSELCKDHGVVFSGTFYFVEKNKVKWSLRSVGFDVSRIARLFGGNGHQCSSGFVQSIDQFYKMMSEMKIEQI